MQRRRSSSHATDAPKSHGSVIGQFSLLTRSESEEGRLLGRAFYRAEDTRVSSDYSVETIVGEADAALARATAQEFVAYCRFLLQ